MQPGRTIAAVFIILVLAAPLLFLGSLQLRQAYIRHTAAERMEARMLKTIFVPTQHWKRINSREIFVCEKMFDLKQVLPTSEGYIVTGVFDDDETAIAHQLDAACKKPAPQQASALARAFHLLQHLFYQPAPVRALAAGTSVPLFQKPMPHLAWLPQPVLCPPPQV